MLSIHHLQRTSQTTQYVHIYSTRVVKDKGKPQKWMGAVFCSWLWKVICYHFTRQRKVQKGVQYFGLLAGMISVTRLWPLVHMWLWLWEALLFWKAMTQTALKLLHQGWGNIRPRMFILFFLALPPQNVLKLAQHRCIIISLTLGYLIKDWKHEQNVK